MSNILKFSEYIVELYKIKSSSSSTGRTKYIDNILDEPTSTKSLSSSVLLRDKLREEELDSIFKDLGGKVPKHAIKDIVNGRKNKYDAINRRVKIALNNLKFLKDKLKEDGVLYCEYCPNKKPLVIYDFTTEDQDLKNSKYYRLSRFVKANGATCDHKIPISKGGDKFDYNNLAVCCYYCNQRKSNMNYLDWMSIISQ